MFCPSIRVRERCKSERGSGHGAQRAGVDVARGCPLDLVRQYVLARAAACSRRSSAPLAAQSPPSRSHWAGARETWDATPPRTAEVYMMYSRT